MKHPCDVCGKLTRAVSLRRSKNKFVCYQCYVKRVHVISQQVGRPLFSLQQALDRSYLVKGYLAKDNTIRAVQITVPSILIGHKVKLVLADEVTK